MLNNVVCLISTINQNGSYVDLGTIPYNLNLDSSGEELGEINTKNKQCCHANTLYVPKIDECHCIRRGKSPASMTLVSYNGGQFF